jgi:[ribosomal protein S5]-alanine N-acetyltransferase
MNVLETERLLLCPLTKSYCTEDYLGWINNDEVLRFLETKRGSTIQDLKEYLHFIEINKIFAWAIVIKETDKHIGNIKIDPIDSKHGYGEYGIMMGDRETRGVKVMQKKLQKEY